MQQLILDLAPAPEPTIENFFAGRNQAALAALQEALGPGERFVYLWGARGSGKTHLLRAFVARAAGLGRACDYAHGARWEPLERAPWALAADDVQCLDRAGQLGLFDCCNRLRAQDGALAAAGDRPPADLPLREDLRTRLASGVVLQVHALSDGEKAQAMQAHAERRGLALAPEIAEYLLSHAPRDLRTLITVLDALDRLSLEAKRPINLALVREALKAWKKD